MFKNEIVEDRKRIQKLNEKAEQLLALDIPEIEQEKSVATDDATMVDSSKHKGPKGNKEFTLQEVKESIDTKVDLEIPPQHSPKMPSSARSSRVGISSSAGIQRSSTPMQGSGLQRSAPQQRPSSVADSSVKPGKLGIIAAAALLMLSVFGPEFGVKVPFLSDLFGDWIGGTEARLILEGDQKGVTVAINGKTVANALPATINGLTVGTPFRVTVTGSGGSFQQEVSLRKGEKKTIPIILSPEKSADSALSPATNGAPAPGEKSILLKMNFSPGEVHRPSL